MTHQFFVRKPEQEDESDEAFPPFQIDLKALPDRGSLLKVFRIARHDDKEWRFAGMEVAWVNNCRVAI